MSSKKWSQLIYFTLIYRSLQSKHSQEILLLESVKSFFKQRFALEKQHFESLSKICATQYKAFECLKKLPPNDNNDVSNEMENFSAKKLICSIFYIAMIIYINTTKIMSENYSLFLITDSVL